MTEEEHEAMRKALATCLCDGSSSAGTVTSEDYTAEDVDFNSILNGLAHNKAVDISENAIEKSLTMILEVITVLLTVRAVLQSTDFVQSLQTAKKAMSVL